MLSKATEKKYPCFPIITQRATICAVNLWEQTPRVCPTDIDRLGRYLMALIMLETPTADGAGDGDHLMGSGAWIKGEDILYIELGCWGVW